MAGRDSVTLGSRQQPRTFVEDDAADPERRRRRGRPAPSRPLAGKRLKSQGRVAIEKRVGRALAETSRPFEEGSNWRRRFEHGVSKGQRASNGRVASRQPASIVAGGSKGFHKGEIGGDFRFANHCEDRRFTTVLWPSAHDGRHSGKDVEISVGGRPAWRTGARPETTTGRRLRCAPRRRWSKGRRSGHNVRPANPHKRRFVRNPEWRRARRKSSSSSAATISKRNPPDRRRAKFFFD